MAELYVEARNNGWNDRVDLRPPSQTPEQYYATPNASRGVFRVFEAFLNPSQYGEGTFWQREIFRQAPISNYQLTVSGGTNKLRYLLNGGYFNQRGSGLGNFTNIFNVATLGNPDLTWETSYKWNIGIDVGILENRIRFVADIYRNLTKDMLLNVSIPSSSGFITALQNVGNVENKAGNWPSTRKTLSKPLRGAPTLISPPIETKHSIWEPLAPEFLPTPVPASATLRLHK